MITLRCDDNDGGHHFLDVLYTDANMDKFIKKILRFIDPESTWKPAQSYPEEEEEEEVVAEIVVQQEEEAAEIVVESEEIAGYIAEPEEIDAENVAQPEGVAAEIVAQQEEIAEITGVSLDKMYRNDENKLPQDEAHRLSSEAGTTVKQQSLVMAGPSYNSVQEIDRKSLPKEDEITHRIAELTLKCQPKEQKPCSPGK